MYTAVLRTKEETPQGLRVSVEFSNGTKTFTESVIPQDEAGLKHWVKSRLASLNSIEDIDANYAENTEIVPETQPEPTADELAQAEWFRDFFRMQQVQKLIDLGIIPNDHAKVTALRTKLQTNLQASYIDAL